MQSHFTHDLFEFLLELRANNNREWFGANKGRYERHLKEPLLAFIEDFEPYLHSISEHFVADTRANGGSMFRIYRDVRFSKDKTPYKTQAAVPLSSGQALQAVDLREGVDQAWPGTGVLYFSRLSERLSQSRMSRIASTPEYQNMTIRNWRTTTRLLSLLDERSAAQGA